MKHSAKTQNIALFTSTESRCCYLPSEKATNHVIDPNFCLDANVYEVLSKQGFRRSGNQVYRPGCNHCTSCIATRIEVDNFVLSRRFKRVIKKNSDLSFSITDNIDTEEHYALYKEYIEFRHADGSMYPPTHPQFIDFLECNWMNSQIFEWRLNDKLISVAVTDEMKTALSAIYTFFSVHHENRSLGTLAVIEQINQLQRQNKKYLYLGYWIDGSKSMQYKSQYRPLQGFINGKWQLIKE